MKIKDYILEYSDSNQFIFGYKYNKILYRKKTPFQEIEIIDTPLFGRTLRLDNFFQTSEGDEFFYHEPLIHVPLISHPRPERVLIIGGGDGGSLREVLKHSTVKKAILAEIDEEVVFASKKYLKNISKGSFDNPRAEVYLGDGKKFVEQTKEKFDAVILDLTDPTGPAVELFRTPFYKTIAERLTERGIVSLQSESPIVTKKIFIDIIKNLKKVFKIVRPFLIYVPLYGSLWSITLASNTLDPAALKTSVIAKRLQQRKIRDLKWYNPATHQRLFILPPYLEKMID